MATERYITDNPFRALAVGSAVLYADLRRRADGAARSASVGLAPEVPQQALFGSLELSEISSAVRSLDKDRERRTVLRILWPLSAAAIPLLTDGGTVSRGALPAEELAQLLFLSSWFAYLEDGSPTDAAEALERWQELYTNETMDDRLVDLLVKEDGLERDYAYDVVLAAQNTLALHVLGRVAAAAASAWESGDTATATKLAKAILESPVDDDLEEQALAPLADCGHRLEERVLDVIRNMPAWRRGNSTEAPKEVVQLARLGELLSKRHPAAVDWIETAARWRTSLCWRMRQESLRLNNEEKKNTEALQVVQEALRLSNDPEQKAMLKQDVAALMEIVEDEKKETAYEGIQKIDGAPSMSTINGLGTKLYGHEPFAGDSRFYFAVLYFVVLYLPVFPLTRYLVADGERGGWHFLGKTAWTKGMKVHLAASCVAIVAFCIYLANQPPSTYSSADTTDSSATSYTSSYNPPSYSNTSGTDTSSAAPPVEPPAAVVDPKPNEVVVTSAEEEKNAETSDADRKNIDYGKWLEEQDAKEKRRDGLKAELDGLKAELDVLDPKLKASKADLASQRASLDALKERIDSTEPDKYSQQEIDEYNAMVDEYNARRSDFNAAVRAHNRLVDEEKRKVRRHNAIVRELNASR